MILRMTLIGCLLAAAGYAQLGTDGQPITMHNDPTTFFNGSLQIKFTTETFMPQAAANTFFPKEGGKTLLQHGHTATPTRDVGTQLIVVLKPSATTPNTLQRVSPDIQLSDTDQLLLSLDNGQKILVKNTDLKGAGTKIPVHANLSQAFDQCISAVNTSMPAGAAASHGGHPGKVPTNVTLPIKSGKMVAFGTKLELNAVVTPVSVTTTKPLLWENGAWTKITGVQTGAEIQFTVTPSAGQHCFAIEYPGAGKFDNSKSAETCFLVLPAGCPVMTDADLKVQKDRATAVADTVWVIHGDSGFEPAQKDKKDNQATIVRYKDKDALIKSVQVDGKPDTNIEVDKDCGAVHFCKMLDTKDSAGNWTMKPDCGKVTFQCHQGQTYTWTPE